jgi:hypothetical protein
LTLFGTTEPLGFAGGDANLYRYVGNDPTGLTDPTGLSPWSGIAKILGKKWSQDRAERAGESLAKELLTTLARHRPDSQKAQEIIRQFKAMGWVEGPLGKQSEKFGGIPFTQGGGLILREIGENGVESGRFLEWHPGGGHHGPDPYWKFVSGESGKLWTVGGTVGAVAIALIPGAEEAMAGDYNGGAREFAYQASPLGWGSWIASYWTWIFDWSDDPSNRGKSGTIKLR